MPKTLPAHYFQLSWQPTSLPGLVYWSVVEILRVLLVADVLRHRLGVVINTCKPFVCQQIWHALAKYLDIHDRHHGMEFFQLGFSNSSSIQVPSCTLVTASYHHIIVGSSFSFQTWWMVCALYLHEESMDVGSFSRRSSELLPMFWNENDQDMRRSLTWSSSWWRRRRGTSCPEATHSFALCSGQWRYEDEKDVVKDDTDDAADEILRMLMMMPPA